MAERFLFFFFLFGCKTKWGKKGHARGGGRENTERRGTQKCRFSFYQHTTTTTIWYHHLSLTSFIFFFILFSCVRLRVLCRRLKVRQIDAKGPRIYQMELSDYLRFFFFVFFYLSIDVFTPVVNTRSSYTSVPKTNKPLFFFFFFFFQLASHKSLRAFSRKCE